MKKSISTVFLILIMLAGSLPLLAQKSGPNFRRNIKIGTQFSQVTALTEGSGVLVRWEMKTEFQNAGFNVYRIDYKGKALVNEAPVIGSLGRYGPELTYGESYQVFDNEGSIGSVYVVETLGTYGHSVSSKTFGTATVKNLEAATGLSNDQWTTSAFSENKTIKEDRSILTSELSQVVQSSMQIPDLSNHRWVVSQPGAKIAVRKEGLYRVTVDELASTQFQTNSDPSKWRLFLDGVEQSIIVGPGGQYIEFYGKGIDTPESDTRFYYLISGDAVGKRIPTRIMRSVSGFATATNYTLSAQTKERISYITRISNGDEENYWGRLVTSDQASMVPVPFVLSGVDFQSPTAVVTIRMQGFSLNNHNVIVKINGHELSQMSAAFHDNFASTVTIPTSYLTEGSNLLALNSQSGNDFSLFDSITVKYARKYQADQNKIAFYTPGYKKVNLTGFDSPNIRVFDTTADGAPILISNVSIVPSGAGFTATLPANRSMVSYAVEDSAILESPAVINNAPSDLFAPTNGADLIIVSHSATDFMLAAEDWANYRRAEGFTVKVVDIADVYDEFGYGVASSNALKEFFENAYTKWQLRPQYVLLIGDGSYDARNYEGFGYNNLIPTKSVRLIYEESGSDEALADFDGDGLAEMAIGRIPARTFGSIVTIFNKTKAFETSALQSFDRGALFAYDLPNGYDFAGMSQTMRKELPDSVPSVYVARGPSTASSELISEMNKGKFVINYSGHGSTGVWAASSFFGINSVPSVTNGTEPSIYNMLTCLNGFFLRPDADSLGESLLKSANGGAVSAWASTSETTPDVQLIMGARFYNKLGSRTIPRMGDLVKDAKTSIPAGADVRLSWALLGDPMLRVIAPTP